MKKLFPLFVFLLLINGIFAQNIIPKPATYQSVVDKALILKPNELAALKSKLNAFKEETTNEIVVLLIESLNGTTVESYANRVFNNWGIGLKGKDNGILLLIALNDRKMRIETGYGVEDIITDTECAALLNEILKPNFKNEDYYEGIEIATNYMIKELSKDFNKEKYALHDIENIDAVDYNLSPVQRRKDSFNPWFGFLLSLGLQFAFGFLIFKRVKKIKWKAAEDSVSLSLIIVTVLFVILAFMAAIIADEEKLKYSTVNKIFLYFFIVSAAIYLMVLLPKKVGQITLRIIGELLRLLLSAIAAMIASLFVMIFTENTYVFITVWTLITALFYYLSITGKLDWLAESGGGSSYSGSRTYSGSSYSSSGSSSSSSYGGGSSGGGGASGSW